ncbi:MAG TPA: toluene-4-monooxygenase system B family protein [Polyangiaceae bacterium]|nr:toluene-4-monooxygenase system B family protein [Polyangiaceae bacterium]
MMVPVYGFLQGDVMGVVVLAQDHETLTEVAAKLFQAASMRVAPYANYEMRLNGRPLQIEMTVTEAGILPLDRLDIVRSTRRKRDSEVMQ